jgi:hypothetical protein
MTPNPLPAATNVSTSPVVVPVHLQSPSQATESFVDRRHSGEEGAGHQERRQFGSSHRDLSKEGRELALAIDRYKLEYHRRYLTCDELLSVISSLGYRR